MSVTEDKIYEADTSFSTIKNKRPVVDTNEEVTKYNELFHISTYPYIAY